MQPVPEAVLAARRGLPEPPVPAAQPLLLLRQVRLLLPTVIHAEP